jgi:hypothetical protein
MDLGVMMVLCVHEMHSSELRRVCNVSRRSLVGGGILPYKVADLNPIQAII